MISETSKMVLSKIIETPGLSRADLSRIFDINRSTCSYITKELLDENLILFRKEKNNGRLGQYIYFNSDFEQVLCIELGKRKFKFFISNLEADIQYQEFIDIEDLDLEMQIKSLNTTIEYIKTKYPYLKNVIIAIHGTVDNYKHILHSPFSALTYNDLEQLFSNHELNFRLINESNAYTLGMLERLPFSSGICINMKDGVGAGVIVDSKLVTGVDGIAGEIGHFIIEQNGKQCNCGNKGCIELYISDTNTLIECRQKTLSPIRKRNINEYYHTNFKVKKIIETNIDYLAILINNMSLLLNPDFIYISSEVYSKIDDVEDLLNSRLKSENMSLSNLKILEYDLSILVSGLCKTHINAHFE